MFKPRTGHVIVEAGQASPAELGGLVPVIVRRSNDPEYPEGKRVLVQPIMFSDTEVPGSPGHYCFSSSAIQAIEE